MLINAYCTVRELPPLALAHKRRDLGDPELVPHLRGFAGFVTLRGTRPMTPTLFAVLTHLERVQHHVTLETEDVDTFAAWAQRANAILFLTDSTVRAPDGRVLVAPDTGEAQPGAQVPHPADAIARAGRTRASLAARNIVTPSSLPPVIGEAEVAIRTDVVPRIHALFACALRGESIAGGQPLTSNQIAERVPVTGISPSERAFLADPAPTEQAVIDAAWRYEAVTALAWALGWLPALPYPSQTCDVPAIARLLLDPPPPRPRSTAEILDMLDLTYRLHWAVVEQQQLDVEPGVVVERHTAFAWLTGDADWDDVQPST